MGGKDAQKISICSFREHVIAFLTKGLSHSLTLSSSLNPLNYNQMPLRHQNKSQTILNWGDCCLPKKITMF